MKTIQRLAMPLLGLALGVLSHASASTVLVGDNFTGTAGATVVGVAAETTVSAFSGNLYARKGSTGNAIVYDTNGTRAKLVQDEGLAYSFGADSDYASLDLSSINLSVTFDLGTLTGNLARNDRGVGIGFYASSSSSASANDTFYGLMIDPLGQLTLMINGAQTPLIELATFTALSSGNHTLSYNVNTQTGAFSDVFIDGVSISVSATGYTNDIFQGSVLSNIGLIVKSNTVGASGYIDSFSVTAIPEPASVAALAGAAAMAAVFLRRRKSS